MRDEVDLIMKRLRIPWRERVGGQVRERERRRERQGETEVEREREKERSQERLKRWGIFSHWVRIVLC